MNPQVMESQLACLERLVPYVGEHGCDLCAQDAAATLMRSLDTADLGHEHKALAGAYAELRIRLQAISEGRSGSLPVDQVACFSRFYREHWLRTRTGIPGSAPRPTRV